MESTNSQTFRLFISSTFNDFRREREVLQTRVFPEIKHYCSQKGFAFQPIDLRWGVSNETQLDQKTLALCLDEVRACKNHPHPNFLVMIGDRYGWVPLPYAIEQSEFEQLIEITDKKEHLLDWYKLDLNQLPASYILKERTGDYTDFNTWNEVETELRETLQNATHSSTLSEEKKRKYFLSATEAEVEEGIIPYIKPTPHQQGLLKANTELNHADKQHIFGFFRDVDKTSQQSDKFIGEAYQEAQDFKARVKKEIVTENSLHIETSQRDENSLNEDYLTQFEQRTLAFLKATVDAQAHLHKSTTPLEKEQQAQHYFAQQKRRNFIGQEAALSTISNYITSENEQPLIVYGPSGRGKSAVMAKAIEHAQAQTPHKVHARFIGATPHSNAIKSVLISIFDSMNIDIRSEQEKLRKEGELAQLGQEKSALFDQEQESFEDFSYRVHDVIKGIKENIIIFIDAIDQLSHDDQFLWLPRQLPHNVKIIISALDDLNYKNDSHYLDTLKNKSDNCYELPPFTEPAILLNTLLKQEGRTLQPEQEKYVLQRCAEVNSPLYIMVAVQELKHWKSSDTVSDASAAGTQSLAITQQAIIAEYIQNLSTIYHHDKMFVEKVLAYLYASRDGLSESELLQLLSIDEKFIEYLAPETFHDNPNKELPLVIWARLYTQLKPFLSQKSHDGETLLYFFHREFEDVIKNNGNQQHEHEQLIEATQKWVTHYQQDDFYSNRWGKLYATLITEYELRYGEKLQEYSEFVARLNDEEWQNALIESIQNEVYPHTYNTRIQNANACSYSAFYMSKCLYQKNQSVWKIVFANLIRCRASFYYEINRVEEALLLGEESLAIFREMYEHNPSGVVEEYTFILSCLAGFYWKSRLDKALTLQEESLLILRDLYRKSPSDWEGSYTFALMAMASYCNKSNRIEEAIALEEENLSILRELYQQNSSKWVYAYMWCISAMADHYSQANRIEEAFIFAEESLTIARELYQPFSREHTLTYTRALMDMATFGLPRFC
jgi:hypothetical protein